MGSGEDRSVEYVRPGHDARHSLVPADPPPARPVGGVSASLGRAASVGIFLVLFIAFLYFGRTILLPVVCAAVVAFTLAPLVKAGDRRGISPWIMAILIVLVSVGALSLAVTASAGPVSEWVGRAPEIWANIKEKFAFLEQPLAAAR